MMFILGSANFGNVYPGSKTYVDAVAAKSIIGEFVKLGGTKIDTAEAYGNSQEIVRTFVDSTLQVSTKFSSELLLNPPLLKQYLSTLSEQFGTSLSAIFLHDSEKLDKIQTNTQSVLYEFLERNSHIKFGVSVYYPEEVYRFYDLFPFMSILQAPLNYFDRRFISDKFKMFCVNRNIEINYRSIFLQGSLLLPKKKLNPYFSAFEQFTTYYNNFQNSGSYSLIDFNLKFINQVTNFSNIVLGIEGPQQIHEIVGLIQKIKQTKDLYQYNDITFDEKLCIPMHWKLH